MPATLSLVPKPSPPPVFAVLHTASDQKIGAREGLGMRLHNAYFQQSEQYYFCLDNFVKIQWT